MATYSFNNAPIVNLSVNLDVKADGNLAVGSDVAAGTKKLNFPGFAATATADDADAVFDAVLKDITGAKYDMLTVTRQEISGVKEGDD